MACANFRRSALCSRDRWGFSRGRLAATGIPSRSKAFFNVALSPGGTREALRMSRRKTSRSFAAFLINCFLTLSIFKTAFLEYNLFRPRVSLSPRLYVFPFNARRTFTKHGACMRFLRLAVANAAWMAMGVFPACSKAWIWSSSAGVKWGAMAACHGQPATKRSLASTAIW